jgi:hypothetical protein
VTDQGIELQFVFRNFDSIIQCLRSFDLTCVGAAIVSENGYLKVLCTPEAITGAKCGVAFHYPGNKTSVERLEKYAARSQKVYSETLTPEVNSICKLLVDETGYATLDLKFICANKPARAPNNLDVSPKGGEVRRPVVCRLEVLTTTVSHEYALPLPHQGEIVKLHLGFSMPYPPKNLACINVPTILTGKDATKRMK